MLSLFLLIPLLQSEANDGLLLFHPLSGNDTLLMDNSGEVIHTWSGSSGPGLSVKLLKNGVLLRTQNSGQGTIGGSGGGVQKVAFDGTILWDYACSGADYLSHHDVEPLPNGNVLILKRVNRGRTAAIDAGRDPALLRGPDFWAETVIEVKQTGPTSGEIVWEWDLWDNLIQDFDATRPNFGNPADYPERMDINFPPSRQNNGDWNHVNGIAYNPDLDQILLSSHGQDEIWILDHSVQNGGFLYRWGNPEAYGTGTAADRKLFNQHNAQWIEPGLPGEGNILIFNNGSGRPGGNASTVDELVPPLNVNGNYDLISGQAYGPDGPVWSYGGTTSTYFYAMNISGCQRQPNGNTLVCVGPSGYFFEVNNAGNQVWDYQYDFPGQGNDQVFRVNRYQQFLFAEPKSLLASAGGSLDFNLLGGTQRAGRPYGLLGSMSGTSPGTQIAPGVILPLNRDWLFTQTFANSAPYFSAFRGNLDASGNAQAGLDTLGPLPAFMVGRTVHFAFALGLPLDFTSQPVAIEIRP